MRGFIGIVLASARHAQCCRTKSCVRWCPYLCSAVLVAIKLLLTACVLNIRLFFSRGMFISWHLLRDCSIYSKVYWAVSWPPPYRAGPNSIPR